MIQCLTDAALAAGKAILNVYETLDAQAVHHKNDGSPVTLADQAAEHIIIQALTAQFPHIPIVAEEACSQGQCPTHLGDSFFLVDPLDGTKEFINKNHEFTVNIAYIQNQRPVMGVVYAPALNEIYMANDNQAYFGKIAQEDVAKATPLTYANIDWQAIHTRHLNKTTPTIVASKSHLSQETLNYLHQYKEKIIISAGSSLKFCKIAIGQADLYPRHGATMQWDTAAADAVLRAAGGQVIALDTMEPILYGDITRNGRRFENPWFIASGSV